MTAMRIVTASEARALAAAELAKAPRATRTNYFAPPFHGEKIEAFETPETLVLLVPELDFRRLYYVSRDAADLRRVVSAVPGPANIIVSHIHKDAEPEVSAALEGAGCAPYATYRRMTNRALRAFPAPANVDYADASDGAELLGLISGAFDRYTDHFPSAASLAERLQRREVLVRRRDGRITGFVIFVIDNSVCNFNYLYSSAEHALDTMTLLQTFYAVLHERGIRRGFLWSDVRKSSLLRMHERFGWKSDGLVADYYLRSA